MKLLNLYGLRIFTLVYRPAMKQNFQKWNKPLNMFRRIV